MQAYSLDSHKYLQKIKTGRQLAQSLNNQTVLFAQVMVKIYDDPILTVTNFDTSLHLCCILLSAISFWIYSAICKAACILVYGKTKVNFSPPNLAAISQGRRVLLLNILETCRKHLSPSICPYRSLNDLQ
jgi:hypothetical protein